MNSYYLNTYKNYKQKQDWNVTSGIQMTEKSSCFRNELKLFSFLSFSRSSFEIPLLRRICISCFHSNLRWLDVVDFIGDFWVPKQLNYFQTIESSLNCKSVKAAGRREWLYGLSASTSSTHPSEETIIKEIMALLRCIVTQSCFFFFLDWPERQLT